VLLGLLRGEVLDGAPEGGDAVAEGVDVPDGARVGQRLPEPLHAARDVGGGGAGLRPLLEEAHLRGEVGVLALEVGEGLGRRSVRVLADPALAVALEDVHDALLVDASPGVRLGRLGGLLGRAGCDGRSRPRCGAAGFSGRHGVTSRASLQAARCPLT